LIEAVMGELPCTAVRSLEDVLTADRAARECAEGWLRIARRSAVTVS
jgi:hypothetical protein